MATPKTKYAFRVNDKVIYAGRLYEQYKDTEGIILSKSHKHQNIYYKVQFQDGQILTLGERMLSKSLSEEAL